MIYGLFVAEGMVISIASILSGLLLAWPLSIVASSFFGNLMLGNGASLHFAFSNLGFVDYVDYYFVFRLAGKPDTGAQGNQRIDPGGAFL